MRQPSEITLPNGRTLAAVLADNQRWQVGEGGSRADLRDANLRRADLRDADLADADLRRAYLAGANLGGTDLRRAYLGYAYLGYANLADANLADANLRGAKLRGANLAGANLAGANLGGTDLRAADLSAIAEDVRALVRDYPTHEVLGLLRALYLGTVDGSTYSGPCACLVGTIALTRRCPVDDLHTDASRPAERWALAIRPGDCAPHNQIAALTAEWIEAELRTRDDYQPGLFGARREEVPEYASPEAYEATALAMLERARQMRSGAHEQGGDEG